jgi:hypothetical protein
MGYSATWCAVPESKAEHFLDRLGLKPTGECEEFPESLISTARLDTGWRVVWYEDYDCPFLRPQDLARLSVDQDVLLCKVEEHVMASSAELWSGGKRKWWLSHEGEDGPKGLATDGALPAPFQTIRSEMEKVQLEEGGDEADVDYIFEIPLRLAQSIVGFKHDENSNHVIDNEFEVLSRSSQ